MITNYVKSCHRAQITSREHDTYTFAAKQPDWWVAIVDLVTNTCS